MVRVSPCQKHCPGERGRAGGRSGDPQLKQELVCPGPTPSHLRRAVAADGRGAGAGAGARDVAVLAVAASPWWVPSRAVAGRWWRLLRWWLWWWWLLWGWLLLGSAAIAASVVGVVIPAVVTPAVRVIATTSAAVETYIGETRQEAHHSQLGTLRSWVVLVTAVAPA